VINGQYYAGAERVQDLLAQRLPECGFEVCFACVKPGQFAARRMCQEVPLYDLPMRARIDLRPALALARLVRQSQAVLLHAHSPRSLMIARLAAMRASVPLIYHVHSPTSRDSTHTLRNWLNSATEQFSLVGVDRLIAVSHSLARHMRNEGVAEERIVTIPNGVPSPGPLLDRAVPSGTWTLGTVALFRPRKGLEILLQCVARLARRQVPVRLLAVGPFETPQYEKSIHELVDQLGIRDLVEWVGFTPHVSATLATMDLFVLPSLFGEGMPMVILEAMAAGVPVVATRVEGIPEALRDGVDGVLADAGSVDDLQRAILSIVTVPQRWMAMRASAYRRHAEHFSDRRMAERLSDVYRDVLDHCGTSLGDCGTPLRGVSHNPER
jgi:glycosyltransferase involved in cell wall biosynthesis